MRNLQILPWLFAFMLSAHSQTITGSFSFGGQTRTYRVYLPDNFSSSVSLPLMINMHGRGSNGQQQELYTGMDAVADTGCFVVAYPDAVTVQGAVQWNVFGLSSTPDDVGFISALIDTLHRRYNIDLSRVYATGLSSGGFMSYKLGCALSCRIAAIAPVAGLLVNNPLAPCNLSRPVALFHIHGTADGVVPYNGLPGVYSVHETIAQWRSKIGCPGTPAVTNLPDINTGDGSTVIDSSYRPCNNSTEITLYAVINGGHTWPGSIGPNTNQDFKASSAIWLFLKKYSIPAASLSISGLASSYCQGASAVTLTGTPSGGSFSGTGVSGNTFNPSGLSPGTYTITYSRASGSCTYSTTATTTISAGVSASISPSSVTICGGSATLTASGGGTYSWSTGSVSASITVSPSSTTTYTVTVTSGGCTATASRTVTVTAGLTATISPALISICNGDNVTLTADGGINYSWSNGSASASITVNPSSTTIYSVTVSDAGGSCTATTSRTVTVNPSPNATIYLPPPICIGGSVTLAASGGTNYTWSNGSASASTTVSPSTTTTYIVTVTDANGCTASASGTVTVNPNPAATISPATVTICSGSVILTAGGGSSYSWSNGNTAASITVSPVSTTTYSVTVADANGCTATASRTVNVAASLTASVAPASAAICEGETVFLTASGGMNYSWSTSETTETINAAPASTTVYSVTVTDAGGSCSATASATVMVNPKPTAIASASPAFITQGSAVTLTATGGVQYSWSSGQMTASFTDSPAVTTVYSVTVTDASGCTDSAFVTVTVLPSGSSEPTDFISINIFPNPASRILNMECRTSEPAAWHIEIFSVVGKKILDVKQEAALEHHLQISLRQLHEDAGIYSVRFNSVEGIVTRKVVFLE